MRSSRCLSRCLRFLTKDATSEQIRHALQAAIRGEAAIDPSTTPVHEDRCARPRAGRRLRVPKWACARRARARRVTSPRDYSALTTNVSFSGVNGDGHWWFPLSNVAAQEIV
jgi:hypothetical protein